MNVLSSTGTAEPIAILKCNDLSMTRRLDEQRRIKLLSPK
jgi:hypothetical protein